MCERRHPMRGLLALVFVVAVGSSTAAAGGADPKGLAVAQTYVNLAVDLYKMGKYDEAVEAFEKAFKNLREAGIDVPPNLYRALAKSYDQIGQVEAALENYDLYLAQIDKGDKKQRKELKQVKEARQRILIVLKRTKLKFKVKPVGATVRIGEKVLGTTPLEPVVVKPGEHELTIEAEGYVPTTMTVGVAAGAATPVVVALEKKEAPAPQPAVPVVAEVEEPPSSVAEEPVAEAPPPGPQGVQWWTWGLLGTGAAGLAAGTAFGLMSSSALSDREGKKAGISYGEYQQLTDDAEGHASLANVLFGAGLVAAAAGAVFYVLQDVEEDPAPDAGDEPTSEAPVESVHSPVFGLGSVGWQIRF